MDAPEWWETGLRTRKAFGKRSQWSAFATVAGDACRAGRLDVCGRVFEGEASHERGSQEWSPLGPDLGVARNDFGRYGPRLLFDLLEAEGPDRFAEFWGSAAPPGAAFVQAFDTPSAEWVHQWSTDRLGPVQGGPAVLPTTAAATLLLMVGCASFGVARARRRVC